MSLLILKTIIQKYLIIVCEGAEILAFHCLQLKNLENELVLFFISNIILSS